MRNISFRDFHFWTIEHDFGRLSKRLAGIFGSMTWRNRPREKAQRGVNRRNARTSSLFLPVSYWKRAREREAQVRILLVALSSTRPWRGVRPAGKIPLLPNKPATVKTMPG